MTDTNRIQAINSYSIGTNSSGKYGGLIQKSFIKTTKNQLAALFSYVYSVAPTFTIAHHIISFFRIFQIVGPSFGISFDNLWKADSLDQTVMSIVSVFYQIIPVMYNEQATIGFCIAYIVILVLVVLIIFMSSFYYAKNANLPSIVTSFLSFYFATFAQVLHPIAINLTFQSISLLLSGKSKPSALNIAIIVLTFIVTICFIFLIVGIACRTLTFRSNSLMTVSIDTWNLQFFETVLVSALLSLASEINNWVGHVLVILAALVYFGSLVLPFYQGGFIHLVVEKALVTSNLTAGILCIVNLVLILMHQNASLIILFIFIIAWVIIFLICHVFFVRRNINYLRTLDEIADDPLYFDTKLKTSNQFLNALRIGFETAHPICINWSICKMAVERWPKKASVWFAFAKFVAVYPEETQVLEWIYISICAAKIKGSSAQTIKEQCLTISRQRESTLSSDLKLKINKLSKQTNSTKHKLRHVWDVVLQGNISEVEDATKRAAAAIDHNNVDYQRLLRQFPNNRFVTRPYARFLIELIGDSTAANNMLEKTRLLQRGVNVNADQTHVYGLAVFRSLPDRLKIQVNSQNQPISESVQSSIFESEQEDNTTINNENVSVLKERIDDVRIPAIKNTLIMRYLILFLCFIVPFIVIIIIVSMMVKSLETPLTHMKNLSLLGTFEYQVVAFANRWIFNKLGVFNDLGENLKKPPVNLGNSWDTAEQLKSILTNLAEYLQLTGEFRNFEPSNVFIKQAHQIIFSSTFKYNFYKTPHNMSVYEMSLQSAIVDFIMQASEVVGDPSLIVPGIVNTSRVLNPAANADSIALQINSALNFVTQYIIDKKEQYEKVMLYAQIGVIIFIVIVHTVSLILQIKWINQNKENAYLCLTSLPKNLISQLAENLRVLKKDNANSTSTSENGELSKQEENILKVFNTGGSAGIKLGDVLILIITGLLILALEIACTVVMAQFVVEENYISMQNSPQLDYVQGAYAMILGSIYMLNVISIMFSPYPIQILNIDNLMDMFGNQNYLARDYYQKVRYGTSKIKPFNKFSEGLSESELQINCTSKYVISIEMTDVVGCYNADLVYTSLTPFLDFMVLPYLIDKDGVDSHNSMIDDIWSLIVFPIYDSFIAPTYQKIIPSIMNSLKSTETECYATVLTMMAISILIEIVATFRLSTIEAHIRYVLRLLLHCQADVILQTPRIVTILSGDFSSVKYDTATRDVAFFDTVFMNLPESTVYADNMNNVERVNKQCLSLLNCEPDDVAGKPISEFLKRFEGNSDPLLKPTTGKGNCTLYLKKNDETLSLLASSFWCNQKLVITLRDTTTTVRYNTLIKEERAKSDKLLSAILPISLVPRVQAGEKNISFAVQSATIVFMDIVSFTPWCGSLPADKVMSTLNSLFKKFDALVAKYSTMTKIKCIGDCYMAAGGVFSEVNQPAEHAKEVVCFGLDSLNAVKELDEELDQKLQIRIGINTGGPIVAGVLGIGKPTFEILGPAINMAQQMEHHGVPMQVHISRTVYELIYGDSFSIKERGAVEVKGGSVITYLVSGKK